VAISYLGVGWGLPHRDDVGRWQPQAQLGDGSVTIIPTEVEESIFCHSERK